MDIISKFCDWFFRTLGNLSPVIQSYLIRVALILAFACVLPALAFVRHESRSPVLQKLLFVVGVFTGGVLPITWLLTWGHKAKSYLLTLCLLCIVFLPFVLPFFVVRTAGAKQKLQWSIFIVLALFFVLNLLLLL